MRIALYQPDIPQNTGTILRLSACLGVPVDVIGPSGFDLSDRALRRAGMDYLRAVEMERHLSWDAFHAKVDNGNQRVVLLTTKSSVSYTSFTFDTDDILLLGRESVGVPEAVHDAVGASVCIPMQPEQRSLNVAVACGMVVGEALRQTRWSQSVEG